MFFEKEKISGFAEVLRQNNYRKGINGFFTDSLLFGAASSLFALAIAMLANAMLFFTALFCIIAFFLPLLLNYFFHSFFFEQKKRKKELLVPDVLLQASVFPRNTPLQKIIKYIASADYGLLSREFDFAFLEIKKGAPVEQALESIKLRCKSRIIDRAINLLILGYKSGADMSQTFKDAAEDILETQGILRERSATMVIEKYTLLFAGGLLVPAILGLLVGLVQGMNFSSINSLGIGLSPADKKSIFDAAMIANQAYIFEYALLASFFIANQEGNRKKALVYALLLIPLSFASYSIAKGF